MNVLTVTVLFSLCLAGVFILLFLHEQHRKGFAGQESESLLPLTEESPRLANRHKTEETKASGKKLHSNRNHPAHP